jgi:para-nitrobenzyl esterase
MRVTAILATTVFLAGCAASPATPVKLDDTRWTLVAFAPAAGGTGEIRPARPDQYRLEFLAAGRLAAQIDCNRGSGTWHGTDTQAHGGRLTLGPLALTRMLCPPDPLGQRLPQDVENVASWRLVDGRLYLDLAGNAGSYVWEPAQP